MLGGHVYHSPEVADNRHVKTDVAFRSTAFNCTQRRDYFINEACFGDDACKCLIAQLRGRGIPTSDEPGQEDFGWYFTFTIDAAEHCFVLGFQPNDPLRGDRWLGSIERHVGFWRSIFGGRRRDISPKAVQAIDAALRSSPEILDVVWHEPGTDADDASAGEGAGRVR
jgi:hypothetical protein